MPGGDRTGPMGMGPMTGRGAGFCGGSGRPGFTSRFGWGGGYGFGRGRGGRGFGGGGWGGRGYRHFAPRGGAWGRGWGPGWYGPAPYAPQWAAPSQPPPASEMEALKDQAAYLEEQLDWVRKRLVEIEGQEAETT